MCNINGLPSEDKELIKSIIIIIMCLNKYIHVGYICIEIHITEGLSLCDRGFQRERKLVSKKLA